MDPVTICNMALGALGQRKITAFDDESEAAELCESWYEPCVKTVLEQRAWLFATGFIDLGAPQESEDAELPVKFALPSTVIRVLRLDDGSGEFRVKGERRGEWVYTEDLDSCYAKVIRYGSDPSKWTPTFCLAVAYKLAETIATPLTENPSNEMRMEKKYNRELANAGNLDGMQGGPEKYNVTFNGSRLSNRR